MTNFGLLDAWGTLHCFTEAILVLDQSCSTRKQLAHLFPDSLRFAKKMWLLLGHFVGMFWMTYSGVPVAVKIRDKVKMCKIQKRFGRC